MPIKKYPSLTMLFFLTCAFIAAYGATYSGRVVDGEVESPLPDVQVTLLNSAGKATTDRDGRFLFSAELPVRFNRILLGGQNTLRWQDLANAFDLGSAPEVTSITLYNLLGNRIFYRERAPGVNRLYLPVLSRSIYLARITTTRNVYSIKWVHAGNNQAFSFGVRIINATATSRQQAVVSSMSFEKQGYQTKRMNIDSDSTYDSMYVKMKPEIGDYLFDDDTLRNYRLYFSKENLDTLLDYGKLVSGPGLVNSIYVPARLEFEGRNIDSIAVRFRGDQSLWDCITNGVRKTNVHYPQFGYGNGDVCAKFSMKFDFNRYKNDQRLYGLKALNFRSMSFDPSKMHEKLGFSLFHDMGIVAPRAAYVKLYVNDEFWGLFCAVEEIDGRFTKSRFPNSGDGNLYKEIWPENQAYDSNILSALTTNNGPTDTPDIADFKSFRDAVTAITTDSANFLTVVRPIVDISQVVRYMAVDRGTMNFDGVISAYVTWEGHLRHNYFWYHDDDSGLFTLIPWDLDKTLLYPEPNFWTNNQPNGINTVPNWNVVNSSYAPIMCSFDPSSWGTGYMVEPIDTDKFLRLFRNMTWHDFVLQSQFFLDSIFVQDNIDYQIEKWRAQIAGAVGEDPTIDSTEWHLMVDSLSNTIPLMRKNLEMMIDTLIAQ